MTTSISPQAAAKSDPDGTSKTTGGPVMFATLSPADVSAESLDCLIVPFTFGHDWGFTRLVRLVPGASVVEAIRALRRDSDFRNLEIADGTLVRTHNKKQLLLAHYETNSVSYKRGPEDTSSNGLVQRRYVRCDQVSLRLAGAPGHTAGAPLSLEILHDDFNSFAIC